MDWLELLEAASYVVTVIGLPFAIAVFLMEQRKERANEEEETYLQLSDEYAKFMRLVLENADLRLSAPPEAVKLNDEQQERKLVLFAILISLFERAYVLVFEEHMNRQQRRLWLTWEDYMREWCARSDFRAALPRLLQGEDPDFVRTINAIAAEQGSPPGR
jgi:hypothetical protein